MPISLPPFHLAIPVSDLALAEVFYGQGLGCETGRRSEHWIDFNFYGHQLVTHLVPELTNMATSRVDDHAVPIPHFGLVLEIPAYQQLADRLCNQQVVFLQKPMVRFVGQVGEQLSFFIQDPFGNGLEFKAFRDMRQLFAS
ncbi:MAG: glyoxalase [Gammaproteobacteria bacterium]|nr:glyoxalase [Gammaproteobacteria bacterium]